MGNYPEMQRRMRKEIEEQIGGRIPVQDDKSNCHFINAFISEILRFSAVGPMALPHKSISDVEIRKSFRLSFIVKFCHFKGGFKIPKNTTFIPQLYAIMHDDKIFPESESFKPERFLGANGKYVSSRPNGFIPFGLGRRVCLGEKLAFADLFLIITNILQTTQGYEFVLPDGAGSANLNSDPYILYACEPLYFKVLLNKTS